MAQKVATARKMKSARQETASLGQITTVTWGMGPPLPPPHLVGPHLWLEKYL